MVKTRGVDSSFNKKDLLDKGARICKSLPHALPAAMAHGNLPFECKELPR